jgi:two-component system sensor histidine kinase DctS
LITILSDKVSPQLTRGHEVSFTETDGTRLAMHGSLRRGTRTFSAQQVLTLPGNTLLLRLVSWRAGPDLFPNVLTALVTLLSVALLSVLGFLGRDMRRRLQAERNLADALAFRKAMEDSLVTGLLARDMQGRIRYANPAFCTMVGFSAEELLQAQRTGGPDIQAKAADQPTSALPFWPADMVRLHGFKQAHRLHTQPQAREGLETIFVRKDGSRFPVLVFDAPLIDALGVQTGWMSALVDISEQRRIEELSRASQERLQASARLATVGEMASLMSHELNQPLAAISSYATGSLNLLSQGGAPSGGAGFSAVDLQGAFQRIAEQAERAGKVIKSVHNFVRRREGQRESVAPHALLEAIMPLVSLQAQKLQVQVHSQIDAPLPELFCDRTMLEQVLLNLARNGMQAMGTTDVPQRILRFGMAHDTDHGQVVFTVSDQGPGISPEVAKQLFTPFFTTKAEGMGLGLSLCRTVVEQHGGKLEFANGPDQGTIFTFILPA